MTEAVQQESRCKQGLCLIELNRDEEAAQMLQIVAAENGPRWPMVALCHLWKLRLEQRRWREAELIFDNVANRYRFEELAVLLPVQLRKKVVQNYARRARGADSFDSNEATSPTPDRLGGLDCIVLGDKVDLRTTQTIPHGQDLRVGLRRARHADEDTQREPIEHRALSR